jgi:hypothetical protein
LALVLLSVILVGLLSLVVGPWIQSTWNNFNYGNTYHFPRTYQVDANVGHGTPQQPFSHFIALNLGGDIEVIEIPGAKGFQTLTQAQRNSAAHLYFIVHLDGKDANLIPVTVSFTPVVEPGKLDMVVTLLESTPSSWVYYNTGSSFSPNRPNS